MARAGCWSAIGPATLFALAAGCGRVGFLELGSGQTGDARSGDGADGTVDLCAAGDDVCLPSCLAVDPDCVTTCGDSRCVGNAGELCGTTCPADCTTRAVVCGNGECQSGEDGDTCYADCGPAPWTWTAQEQALVTEINLARTGGTMCPGDVTPRFAAALAANVTTQVGAREYAWELAHHQWTPTTGDACNGRTFAERQAPYGGLGGASFVGGSTTAASAAVAYWKTLNLCSTVLMSTTASSVGIAAAIDGSRSGWVMWLK